MAKKSAFNTFLGLGTLALGAAYVRWQNYTVGTTDYFVENPRFSDSLNGFTIAHLSDLHLPDQKVDLNAILDHVYQMQPNIIAITGDIIQTDAAQLDEATLFTFFKALTDIAPTFATFGNHDAVSLQHNLLVRTMGAAGIVHLNDRAITYTYKGQPLTLIGLDDKMNKYFLTGDALRTVELTTEQMAQPKILLAHHPEAFLRYHENINKSPDLVLSGHAHGGQIRIPGIGGLFAPNQGRLPKYTSGVFYLPGNPDKQMVVSRGIGASTFPVRLNNRPEVVAVHLTTDIDRAVEGLTQSIDYVTSQEGGITKQDLTDQYSARKQERAQEHGYFAITPEATSSEEIIEAIEHEVYEEEEDMTDPRQNPLVNNNDYDDDVVDRTTIDAPKYEADEDKVTHTPSLKSTYILLDPETNEKTVVDENVDTEKVFSDNLNEDVFIAKDPKKK
jgi:predicted MPP superfamily phosphohydrolase